ncbi:hypothetical protein G6F47_004794 [Rhizopus delemar]|nr:hypothetical protein G6F54_004241 [Rhizopus delemar]KAG1513428.1 hypothetical protein G6F53_004437 [Rhizopus delemar]KAG1600224.1 hypothetical protein G6F47_004794 [Rhizopus delemar]
MKVDPSQLEDLLKAQLEANDSIEDISNTLSSFYAVNVSPTFCSSLFVPLIQHAIRNKRDLENLGSHYSHTIAQLHDYVCDQHIPQNTQIIKDATLFLRDIIKTYKKRFNALWDTFNLSDLSTRNLLQLLQITTEACFMMIDNQKTTYCGADTHRIWNDLPSIFEASLRCTNIPKSSIINAAHKLLQVCIHNCEFRMVNDSILENLLISILQVLKHSAERNASNEIVDELSHSADQVIRIPWLSQYLDSSSDKQNISPSLDILFTKTKILIESTDTMLVRYSQANIDTMDIDQDSLKPEIQSMHSTAKFNVVDKQFYEITSSIINMLVSLNPGDEKGFEIIAMLKDIASYINTDVQTLLKPHLQPISEVMVRMLPHDPNMSDAIANLLGYSTPQFLQAYKKYTLPYAVLRAPDNESLAAISISLSMTITSLCKTNASDIIIALLMEQDMEVKRQGKERIEQMTGSKAIIRTMKTNNQTQITTALALDLGLPDKRLQAIEALNQMKGDGVNLSMYLSISIIAILGKVAKLINAKREKRPNPEHPHALKSLEEVMKLIGSDTHHHAVHLIKMFYTVSDINGMELDAFQLWNCFIFTLDNEGLKSHLNAIIRGLIQLICRSEHSVRIAVADTIKELLIGRYNITGPLFDQIPTLPPFDELQETRKFIEGSSEMQWVKEFNRSFANLCHQDDVEVLGAVQKMCYLLDQKRTLGTGVGQLFSQLLLLTRKYAHHPEISYAAAVCLGKLGAIDPSRIQVKFRDDKVYVLKNFKSSEENQRFICDLILNSLIPTYHAVNNEVTQQFVSYSIQVLLKCAGFTTVEDMKNVQRYKETYKIWLNFPPSIQEFLAPYLRSSYEISLSEKPIEYPIYSEVHDFSTWVRHWYCLLQKQAGGQARTIFSACMPMIYYGNLDVALYLLPHLVLHIILTMSASETRNIVNELKLVLETNSTLNKVDRNNRLSLQVVVAITEHCRQWMYRIGSEDKSGAMIAVRQFLESIPDILMAKASFYAKAYPQALMHFENYVKTSSNSVMQDAELVRFLRQIYAQAEDMADLQALFAMYTTRFTSDEEIIRAESLGKWKDAEVYYVNDIAKNPHDLSPCTGYLECLKKSGSYASIFYFADKLAETNPQWLPQMNASKMDAAWRIEDWGMLNKIVEQPTIETTETFIARALDSIRKNQSLKTAKYIERARRDLLGSLGSKTSESYRKSYPTIFKLQLLQEMEDAQQAWEANEIMPRISTLEQQWDKNLKLLMPQFQYMHELLELRRAVLYDVRPEHLSLSSSNIWLSIAKYCRKNGHMTMALDAILKAERKGNQLSHRERAKWLWKSGLKQDAVNLLRRRGTLIQPQDALILNSFYLKDKSIYNDVTARQYMDIAQKGTTKREKAFEQYGNYLSSFHSGRSDSTKLKVYMVAVRTACKALSYGSKYYYSSMSKLINSWVAIIGIADKCDDATKKEALGILAKTNNYMKKVLSIVPVYQFGKFLTRLVSHLTVENEEVASALSAIIEHVFSTYPRNSIWFLLNALESRAPLLAKRIEVIIDRARAKNSNTMIPLIIHQAVDLRGFLHKLSKYTPLEKSKTSLDLSEISAFSKKLKMTGSLLTIPRESSLFPRLPEVIKKNEEFDPFPGEIVTITEISCQVEVMRSLQQPKRIAFIGSDGRTYKFLCKANDDLRKDARMMEFNYMINDFLKKNPESRDRNLYIRTYAVIPLGDEWGLIEWIDNIIPLKAIVTDVYDNLGIKFLQIQQAYRAHRQTPNLLDEELLNSFKNILKQCPPVMHKWFIKSFPEPNQWLASRTRYVKTLAVMSIVGHMLGLGDRHAENILFDSTNGDTVHVDLNMLFDKGLRLTVPEVVPFRLTHNLVDAMGVLGYEGQYRKTCEVTLQVLLNNREALIGVFQTLFNEWSSPKAKPGMKNKADEIMLLLEKRYQMAAESGVSTEIERLISTAVDMTNLSKMFPGWAAYI